jgi:hypothetical protein
MRLSHGRSGTFSAFSAGVKRWIPCLILVPLLGQPIPALAQNDSPFSLTGYLAAFSTPNGTSTSSHFDGNELSLSPVYQVGGPSSVFADLLVDRGLTGTPYFTVGKSNLGYRYSVWQLGSEPKTFDLGLNAAAVLPVDSTYREQQYFRGGAYLGPRLNFDLSRYDLKGVSGTLESQYYRLFHSQDTDIDGNLNEKYQIRNALSLTYTFNDTWSTDGQLIQLMKFPTGGSELTQYGFFVEGNYQFNPAWGVSLGLANYPDFLGAVPSDGSARGFDPALNVLYLAVSITI